MVAAMHKKGQKIARLMSNEVLPYKAQFIVRVWDADKAGLRAKLAALRGAISKLNGAKVLRSRSADECAQLLLRRSARVVLGQV